jgi:hypothetical protein
MELDLNCHLPQTHKICFPIWYFSPLFINLVDLASVSALEAARSSKRRKVNQLVSFGLPIQQRLGSKRDLCR